MVKRLVETALQAGPSGASIFRDYQLASVHAAALPGRQSVPYNRDDEAVSPTPSDGRATRASARPPHCGWRPSLRFRALVAAQTGIESLQLASGSRVQGRIAGSTAAGFGFVPADGSARLPLPAGSVIHCTGPGPDSSAGESLFRVAVGEILRLSGSLRAINQTAVRITVGWQEPEVSVARPGVAAVLQRPGVARVFVDDFETLEPSRWSKIGKVSVVDEPHASERRSLRIPPGGAAVSHNLSEPLSAGRFDLMFRDDASVAAGQKWSIDFTFQGPSGPSLVRVVPGWSEESLAVESPSGPACRSSAWRIPGLASLRPPLRTREDRDLGRRQRPGHGKGPDGPLVSIRLGSSAPATARRRRSLEKPGLLH